LRSLLGRWLITATLATVALPLLFPLMLITHEIGHTLVAWTLGDTSASFALSGPSCIGCNYYDSVGMGPLANTLVNLGGVLFTGMLTWAAIAAMSARPVS